MHFLCNWYVIAGMSYQPDWIEHGIKVLELSLKPVPSERNEIDWKVGLSSDKKRLVEHISAFANNPSGGFLVYGINRDGLSQSITITEAEQIIGKLGNLAREGVEPPVILDHCNYSYNNNNLLFIRIPESKEKPVHLRGASIEETFIRSAGQTRKAHKNEIKKLLESSAEISFELLPAHPCQPYNRLIDLIDYSAYFQMLNIPVPENESAIIEALANDRILIPQQAGYLISNLGAILFAKDLNNFEKLGRKAIRVITYAGGDRLNSLKERNFNKGYAIQTRELVNTIMEILPTHEEFENIFRKEIKLYPEIAIRELVVNAMIHQDFAISGTGPMIEIFKDRLELTNPGRSIVKPLRIIDQPPQSRNEALASMMRRLNLCEERGYGFDKVVDAIEKQLLPPLDIIEYENHFKVVLFAPRQLTKMNLAEKVRACYYHACLKYIAGGALTNQSIRERFKISDKNYPMASKIISESMKQGVIKVQNNNTISKKLRSYIPFWA